MVKKLFSYGALSQSVDVSHGCQVNKCGGFFFYKTGETRNDFEIKENHRIPYVEEKFKTLKRTIEFIR